MAQGPTNVNLIATHIHNNPGCRRVDLKRMLHKASFGTDVTMQYQTSAKNQYFQRYGNTSNVYLDRMWYNKLDKGKYTRKSSYCLTSAGEKKVWHRPMLRPFEESSLVEWQWNSPNENKRGWRILHQGLVVERTDLYGLWILPIAGSTRPNSQLMYVSHQAFVRKINDKT